MHSSNNDLYNMHEYELQDHQLFLISKEGLAELVENNHTKPFDGLVDIVSALQTNIDTGIIGDQRDLYRRHKAFGSNFISLQNPSSPPQMRKSLKRLIVDAFKDTTVLLLLCCSVLSLIIGIKTDGVAEAMIMEGSLVFLAVSFVITFGAIFRFFKARWMIKKSLMRKKKLIRVVRSGKLYRVSESELVVGDIVCLQMGDCVPADGIFIHGDSFQLINGGLEIKNCSLFAGAQVASGHCRMLVTSVGENTERSRLMRSIDIHDDQNDHRDLVDAIDEHNSKLEKVWLSVSLIFLVVQLVRCFVWKQVQTDKDRNLDPKGVKNTMEDFMNESIRLMKDERSSKMNGRFVAMLCVLFLATRDGLPLAIFVSLLYASHKMKSHGASMQKLPASATVGLITTICTAKTSDLVLQHENMADLWIGFRLVDDLQRQVDGGVLDVLQEGIFVHSSMDGSCFEEMSLIAWASTVLGLFHGARSIVPYEAALDVDRNISCSIVKGEDHKELHVHWKGAPELILSMCSHYYTVDGKIETLDDDKRLVFLQIFQTLVACTQGCFAFAYKQDIQEEDEAIKDLEHGLTLIGFVGMKNPYSPEVREAIEDCLKSEVSVKLMVEDDINTARIMAVNSGLLRPEDHDHNGPGSVSSIVDAVDFRTRSEEERMNMIDNIHVMANASPADKLLMVQCLKKNGEIVAATTSSIRDSPMLKEADVGIFMGDLCPDLSKEDVDILVLHKTFSQIPGIMRLGKRVCENLEKFIPLQLTLEISVFSTNIISVAVNSKVELSPFQVLWINLILETLGALAVAIITIHTDDPGSRNSKQVYGSSGSVITWSMCRRIAVQSLFQVTVVLVLEMKGKSGFQVNDSILKTIIFNCYALCQVFLLITAMEFKKREEVVTSKSCMFLGTVAMIGVLQVAVVEIIGAVAHRSRLDIKQWCICIGIASFSLPLTCAVNWIPMIPK